MGVGSGRTAPNPDPLSERNSPFTETGLLASWKKAHCLRVCSSSFRTNRDFTPIFKVAFLSLFTVCTHLGHLKSAYLAERPVLATEPQWLHPFEV
jgi:hypothetical protein